MKEADIKILNSDENNGLESQIVITGVDFNNFMASLPPSQRACLEALSEAEGKLEYTLEPIRYDRDRFIIPFEGAGALLQARELAKKAVELKENSDLLYTDLTEIAENISALNERYGIDSIHNIAPGLIIELEKDAFIMERGNTKAYFIMIKAEPVVVSNNPEYPLLANFDVINTSDSVGALAKIQSLLDYDTSQLESQLFQKAVSALGLIGDSGTAVLEADWMGLYSLLASHNLVGGGLGLIERANVGSGVEFETKDVVNDLIKQLGIDAVQVKHEGGYFSINGTEGDFDFDLFSEFRCMEGKFERESPTQTLKEEVRKCIHKFGLPINSGAFDYSGGRAKVLAQFESLLEEISKHPESYGALPFDSIRLTRDLVDNDEILSEGLKGKIEGKVEEEYLVRIRGGSRWVFNGNELLLTNRNNGAAWMSKEFGVFNPGDSVTTKEVVKPWEYGKKEIQEGTQGVVEGYVYRVSFKPGIFEISDLDKNEIVKEGLTLSQLEITGSSLDNLMMEIHLFIDSKIPISRDQGEDRIDKYEDGKGNSAVCNSRIERGALVSSIQINASGNTYLINGIGISEPDMSKLIRRFSSLNATDKTRFADTILEIKPKALELICYSSGTVYRFHTGGLDTEQPEQAAMGDTDNQLLDYILWKKE